LATAAGSGTGMKILITGACGFVGSALAASLLERMEASAFFGIDNLMRPGSEINRIPLQRMGVEFLHVDLRSASDFATLPKCDWVIDAAAQPGVLAGLAGAGSSRRLFEHNVSALGNVLEYCREYRAGLLLLSSSRVYSISALAGIPLRVENQAFALDPRQSLPAGLSKHGIGPAFSTAAPVSLYGATKLASELIASEFASAFDFPVWITRCGVLAGAGQFGTADQGISPFGFIRISAAVRFATSDFRAPAIRRAMHFIARSCGVADGADKYHPLRRPARIHSRRRSGKHHVAGSIKRLVRRTLRSSHAHRRSITATLRHSLGRHGQPRCRRGF